MAITGLNPYLQFDGIAAEVVAFYERALGATVFQRMLFSDAPGTSPELKNRIMHCQLNIGPGVLMVSDTMPGGASKPNDSQWVCLHWGDPADMQTKFDALSAGGKVLYAIHDTFWGAKYGQVIDRFGVHWMFNCEPKKE